jgi:leucyl/phenylalanyl-tRNA--protein transferase
VVYWDDEVLMWEDPQGLVAVGGDLDVETLLGAYRRGIFPWYNEGDPILWWSPDPRTIFEFDRFYISRRLARLVRSERFTITINRAFVEVMRGCAVREEGTWITSDMLEAYTELNRRGFAHSVEAWRGTELAGGVYGVAIGGFFAAESMFHFQSNAGMAALVALVRRLQSRGYQLLDTQMPTEHTRLLGAVDIPREVYLQRLEKALQVQATFC